MNNLSETGLTAEKITFANGREFKESSPGEVLDFLKTRRVRVNEMDRRDIRFLLEEGKAMVELKFNGQLHRIPQRETFAVKLLRWFNIPESMTTMLSPDVFIAAQNQIFRNISSNKVFLKTENYEALSIFSAAYKEVSDVTVIESLGEEKVQKISRNDRMTRLITRNKADKEIQKGDIFTFGFDIVNSETGFAALTASHFLYRLICLNGASVRVASKKTKLNHHIENTDNLNLLLSGLDTNWASEARVIISKLQQSGQIHSQPFAKNVTAELRNITGLKESSRILREFDWGQPLYELFNHLTHSAKSFPVHLRYRIESFAGELVFRAEQRKLTDLEYLEN